MNQYRYFFILFSFIFILSLNVNAVTVLIDNDGLSQLQQETLLQLGVEPLFIPKSENSVDEFKKKHFADLNSRMILTNCESCLTFIENLDLKKLIKICKDKFLFRKLLKNQYPDFFYKLIKNNELKSFDYRNLPYPVVIKPLSGYGSTGVYRIQSPNEWESVCNKLERDSQIGNTTLSSFVFDSSSYLIEEALDGEEIAIDAYYDESGGPVILNIMKRKFIDIYDTSDRVYYTSAQIVKSRYDEVMQLLMQLGDKLELKLFPIHMEMRRNVKTGLLIPIEINPMRFISEGDSDIDFFAFGVNSFKHYINQTSPDWKEVFKNSSNEIYGLFCADIPKDIPFAMIDSIDENKLKSNFKSIIDYRNTLSPGNVYFATVFYRSPDLKESEKLLKLDFKDFINIKKIS